MMACTPVIIVVLQRGFPSFIIFRLGGPRRTIACPESELPAQWARPPGRTIRAGEAMVKGLGRCWLIVCAVAVTAACAPGASPSSQSAQRSPAQQEPGQRKVLNLGLRTILDGFAIAA